RRLPRGPAGEPDRRALGARPGPGAPDHGGAMAALASPAIGRRRDLERRGRGGARRAMRAHAPVLHWQRARNCLTIRPNAGRGPVITYEYPLNERIRTLLRLEDLYERVRHFHARDDAHDHHACLAGMF